MTKNDNRAGLVLLGAPRPVFALHPRHRDDDPYTAIAKMAYDLADLQPDDRARVSALIADLVESSSRRCSIKFS